ncbi:MAG: hypothetical protein AAB969_01050, partial [Patescibacteria group bacterium]
MISLGKQAIIIQPMKILFISRDLVAGNLAYLLKKEGHDVKLYISEKKRRCNFDNLVEKTNNWKKELDWVGKEGLIIFDDVGWGKDQDKLRKKGYLVVGGSEMSDKLEMDREFGQSIFKKYGLKTVSLVDFDDIEEAILHIRKNRAAWVIKRNDGMSKFMSYVGKFDDGRDVENLLMNYLQNKHLKKEKISLHKRVDGIEMGVGRYFNGTDWVGPVEINFEHIKFMPGDIGPATSEMGTVAWYDDNEKNKLFQETLEKIKPYLVDINFKGDFALNCMVNETGAYVLEATSRFGSPIVHLQSEIQDLKWFDFLLAIAKGEKYNLKWKKGYGIVLGMMVPPFPYSKNLKESLFCGVNIYFKDFSDSDLKHIHFEEISKRVCLENKKELAIDCGLYYISDNRGYILYVTAVENTLKETQDKV